MGNISSSRYSNGEWTSEDWQYCGYDNDPARRQSRHRDGDSRAKRREIERRKARRRAQRSRDW